MVNYAPSHGCHKCRERHVKCDETKPHCQKCTARNIECPGYRDANGFVFKDQGPRLVAKQNKREGKQQQKKRPPEPKPTFESVALVAADPEAFCVSFFFRSYILCKRDPRTSQGHFDYVIPFYAEAEPDSPMALATIALSVRCVAMFFKHNRQTALHSTTSLRATKAIRNALMDPALCVRDETLQAVVLHEIATYIDSMSTDDDADSQHLGGAMAIIQHRGIHTFTTSASKALLMATVHHSLHHGLFHNLKSFLDAFLANETADELATNPAKALNVIMARLVWLRAEISDVVKAPSDAHISLLQAAAHKIANQLDCFLESMPTAWHPMATASTSGKTFESWIDLDVACIYNLWRASKLLLIKSQQTLALCDNMSGPSSSHASRTTAAEANELVEKVCEASSFFLQPRRSSGAVDDSFSKQFTPGKRPRNFKVPTTAVEASEKTPAMFRWYYLKVLVWVQTVFNDAPLGYDDELVSHNARNAITGLVTMVRASMASLQEESITAGAASTNSSTSEASDYTDQQDPESSSMSVEQQ